jgi:hypothetical protein
MTKSVWTKDFNKFAQALAPWAQVIDGAFYLRADAPTDLVRPYRALVSIGYAQGWM